MDLLATLGVITPIIVAIVALLTWITNRSNASRENEREDFDAIVRAQNTLIGRLTERVSALEKEIDGLKVENTRLRDQR